MLFTKAVDLSQYQGFIFDMDGTIVDSGVLHEKAWIDAFMQQDVHLDRQYMRSLAGVPAKETIYKVFEQQGLLAEADVVELIYQSKEAFIKQHYTSYVKATSLIEIIKQYYGKVPMAVGTGASTQEAHNFLTTTGLIHYMQAVVGFDQVSRPKPAADTFLLAAKKIEVPAECCLVFEDAKLGIQAGLAANMHVVDVQKAYSIENDYFL